MLHVPRFHTPRCHCVDVEDCFSDHRLLVITVKHSSDYTASDSVVITAPTPSSSVSASVQVGLLTTDPLAKMRYHCEISTLLNKYPVDHVENNTNQLFSRLNETIVGAASATLRVPPSPQTPNRNVPLSPTILPPGQQKKFSLHRYSCLGGKAARKFQS